MQKFIVKIVILAIAAIAIYAVRVFTIERVGDNQIKRAKEIQEEFKELSKQRLEQDRAKAEERRLDEPVEVLVKAKDVRACMADLGTDTLSNEVIECTKDHYVMAKRRDVKE